MKHVSPDDPYIRAVYRAAKIVSLYFKAEVHNIDNIPKQGRVMLVGNHALMGIDTWALLPMLFSEIERVPRGMALRSLFEIPGIRRVLGDLGMMPGQRHTAVELLEREEMVVTYPGGARDSLKGISARYQLQWEGRIGYAYAAMMAQAPIVPIAAIGPDDCFPMLTDMGLLPTPGLNKDIMHTPLFLPIARRIPFEYFVGEPIHPPKIDSTAPAPYLLEQAHDFANTTQQTLQSLLDEGLEQRPELSEPVPLIRPTGIRRAMVDSLKKRVRRRAKISAV